MIGFIKCVIPAHAGSSLLSSRRKPGSRKYRHWIPAFAGMTILLLTNIAFAATQELYPFTSAKDATRFQNITKEIRCVVCQNQNIADSNAPLANDLRAKIYQMILDKKSSKEIKTYLVKRYGEFILLRPRVNKATIFLWSFPFLAFIFTLIFLRRTCRLSYATKE